MRSKVVNAVAAGAAALVVALSIWGPEFLARYKDAHTLNRITTQAVEGESEGYRYSLSSNEKLYILSKCLNNRVLPESELSAMTRTQEEGVDYEEITGTYALVVNRQGPTEKEITDGEIFDICNEELEQLKELGVVPAEVKEVSAGSYTAVLYSAIDVLEPRNNMSVWKVSLSTSQQNADKANRLLDVYLDADTGKIYEFYVRTQGEWEDFAPQDMVKQWSEYLGLSGLEKYEPINPLSETTPYFEKYRFPGMEEGNTVVTVGFYEGIDELFLKISR